MGHVTPWASGPGRCVDAANWADTRPWKSGTLNIKINSSYSHANYSDPKQTLFNISLGSIINLNLKCLTTYCVSSEFVITDENKSVLRTRTLANSM